jgi:outer membrane protein assembly factor BamA
MLWLSTPLHKIFFFPRQVLCIALLVAGMQLPILAQDSIPSAFRRFDVFPAISYSPETKLTLGVIGYAYFDWRGGDLATPLSFVEFLAVYTTANQILFENRAEFFSPHSKWRLRGELLLQRYPDRNYGFGNNAATLVEETEDGATEVVNYLRFNSDRLRFAPSAMRRIGNRLWVGGLLDMESLFNYKDIPDAYRFLNADSAAIQDMPVKGFRCGIGPQALFDNRDNQINARRGCFLLVDARYNGSWLGSAYTYNQYNADLRFFRSFWGNQTLSMRTFAALTYGEAPLRGMVRIGGHRAVRGYFRGTYVDKHMLAFESEYRLPFWRDDAVQHTKLWQVWKRLGLVAFLSGAQTFNEDRGPALDRFNVAAGAGLRILFNPKSRLNIRVDYAVGLSPDSNGPGDRQNGFYLYLGEAF